MKRGITIIFILIFSVSFGQSSLGLVDSLNEQQFEKTLSMTFMNLDEFQKKVMEANITYYPIARESESYGTAIVSFTIDNNGIPQDFKRINEVGIVGDVNIKPEDINFNWSTDEIIKFVKSIKWKSGDGKERYEFAFKFALRNNLDPSEQYYDQAKKYYSRGKYKEAISYYDLIIRINPYDIEALRYRAICNKKLGYIDDACRDNKRLIYLGQKGINIEKCN